MQLSIFGLFFGIFGAAILCTILFYGYKFYRKLKRLKDNDISKLNPGNHRQDFYYPITLSEFNLNNIKKYLKKYKSEIVPATEGIIAYVNTFDKAFLWGYRTLEPNEFPIRISFQKEKGGTRIIMDDNFGFQKFDEKTMEDFKDRCIEAFLFHDENIYNRIK